MLLARLIHGAFRALTRREDEALTRQLLEGPALNPRRHCRCLRLVWRAWGLAHLVPCPLDCDRGFLRD